MAKSERRRIRLRADTRFFALRGVGIAYLQTGCLITHCTTTPLTVRGGRKFFSAFPEGLEPSC